jgi:hypothetical protein
MFKKVIYFQGNTLYITTFFINHSIFKDTLNFIFNIIFFNYKQKTAKPIFLIISLFIYNYIANSKSEK